MKSSSPVRVSRLSGIENDPFRGLLYLSLPLIVAFSIQTGFNVVDAIFVGRISSDAIAAISIAYPVQMVIMALGGGLGIGAQSLIARMIGANDHGGAADAASQGLFLSAFAGIVSTCVGIALLHPVISSLGADASVTALALEYLDIIIVGAPIVFLALMVDSILRGEGDTRRAMIFMGISALLNIVLDPIFIFYLDLGVRGAAIATVLARVAALAIASHYMIFSSGAALRISFGSFYVRKRTMALIARVGFPASLSQLSYSLSLFVLNSILATYGSEVIAAFGIGFRIESLAFLPMFGMAGAYVTVVGYLYGSGKIAEILSFKSRMYIAVCAYMSVCAIVFFAVPSHLYSAFTQSGDVMGMGVLYLRINVLAYPLVPLSIMSASGFQGIGRGGPPMVLAVMRSWMIALPGALIVTFILHSSITHVWWVMVLGHVVSAILGYVWFSGSLRSLVTDTNKNSYRDEIHSAGVRE